MWTLVEKEFRRGASVPLILFPEDGASIQDSPKLTFVILDPESEWTGGESLTQRIVEWTKQRGDPLWKGNSCPEVPGPFE